ncbi:MAG: hypothetical protein AB7I41_04355 [Candidatus Sericytochromatia bacterium]
MKLKSFFALILFLSSCQQPNPPQQIQASPLPSSLPMPSPVIAETAPIIQISTPAPIPTFLEPDQTCLPLVEENIPRKLHYPTDLAVSHDGSQIFVVNALCSSRMLPLELSLQIEKECFKEKRDTPYPQQFIYQVQIPEQKLIPLKIQGEYPGVCLKGDELEMDEKNRLYFNTNMGYDPFKRIYRLDPAQNKAEVLLNPLRADPYISGGVSPAPVGNTLDGPVFLNYVGGKLFFQLFTLGGYRQVTSVYEAEENTFSEILKDLSASSESLNKNINYDGRNYYLATNLLLQQPPVASTPPITKDSYSWKEEYRPLVSSLSFTRINSKGEFIKTSPDKHLILKIIPTEDKLVTLAGNGSPGYRDGQGNEAQFNYPGALTLDAQDNIYVVDSGNHAIRKITPAGVVSTLYKEK